MGLFDEANEQFCKDVKKAWDELWDNDTSDDEDDTSDDDSNSISLGSIFRGPGFPVPDGPRGPNPLDTLDEIRRKLELDNPIQKVFRTCSEPAPGTPVYCNLAVVVEHTGIYI